MAVARAHGAIFSPMHFSLDLTACWSMQQRELREQLATATQLVRQRSGGSRLQQQFTFGEMEADLGPKLWSQMQ